MNAPLPEATASDPHEAKVSPDDPRLRLRRAPGRTLKTAPLVALFASVLGTGMLALAFAFTPSSSDRAGRAGSESTAAMPPAAVPDALRNANTAPARPVRALPDAGALAPESRALSARAASDRAKRTEEDTSATRAAILFETPQDRSAEGPPQTPGQTSADAPNPAGPAGPGFGSPETDPNMQDRKSAFLAGPAQGIDTLAARVQPPQSPCELSAGALIPAVLLTAINSDLPGPVIGQVRENVYDTASGNTLLIPQGARLLATYDSMVMWGQERVLLCWNRLLFPNGHSLRLQCMPAADLQGAAGLTDQVDEHWFRIVKGAAVASLLAATTALAAGNTEGFNPTVPQVMARSAAGSMGQVGQQLTGRSLLVQPTLTIRPGFSVNVIVTKDLVLPPYAESEPALGLRP